MLGEIVSHFEILERLGSGGMGEVYKARDLRLQRIVALKFLSPQLCTQGRARTRFLQEAKAASALEHSNIGTIHEIDETDDGRLFIVMAFLEGESLRERLERGPLPLAEAVDLASQIARGLARAHAAGIVHRDIKPGNLMISAEGEIKIVDFGLAMLAGESRLTGPGDTPGTAAYMSPEQASASEVDHRTDLWSLGVTFFEMLTGSLPFRGENALAMVHSILSDPPAPLTGLATATASAAEPILARLLAKSPTRRFGSAEEAAEALSDLGQILDPTVGTRAMPLATRQPPRFRAWQWLLAGLAVMALGMLGYLGLQRLERRSLAPRFESLAVLPFANLTGDPNQSYLAEGISAGLIAHLSELVELRVAARSEAWRLRDSELTAGQVAKRLGVGSLLEGEVQRQNDLLRVSVKLMDSRSGFVVWSREFEAPVAGLFDLQKEIAGTLTEVLRIPLSSRERTRLAENPTRSFKAYDYYLQAQQALEDLANPRGPEFAVDLFTRATQLDPEFPLAYVGLSEAQWKIYMRDRTLVSIEAAERAAQRALAIDPELPSAQVALARVYRTTGRYAESIAELRQALADHPKPDEAQRELAISYLQVGELEEAEACLRAAQALGPTNWRNWNWLGEFLLRGGRLSEARTAFEQAARLAPEEISWPLENLAIVRLYEGDFPGAIEAFEQMSGQTTDPETASNMGTAYFFTGDLRKATDSYRLAISLNPREPGFHGNLADVLLRQGQRQEAIDEYSSALDLVSSALRDNPRSHELQLLQALYAAKAERCAEALPQATGLRRQLPPTADSDHDLALVFALCGERQLALEALRSAVQLGFSTELIQQEDEFGWLHQDQEFQRLVELPGAGDTEP